jgi:hypothetical protein
MGRQVPDPDPAEEPPEPPRLRQLRWLVNALMLVLIGGVITVTALLVIRLAPFGAAPALPEAIALPEGERAEAVTLGRDWVAVVTTDGEGQQRVRVLDRATGAARGTVEIAPAE